VAFLKSAFYRRERRVSGIRIRAHADVSEAAIDVAAERVRSLLGRCPGVTHNLEAAGAELHVIGKDQAVSDLPMYRHLAGVPFEGALTIDQRGRGYGGLFACCAEESLLALPTARHADHRDVCSHEVAHTVLTYGLDDLLRQRVTARWTEARPRWDGAYAGTNAEELFAEATMWYVGSRGDYGTLPDPAPGEAWLRAHDPETWALLDGIWRGVLTPAQVRWASVVPTAERRSVLGDTPTRLLIVNRTEQPLACEWLDYRGRPRAYAVVGAEGAALQHTYATHVWRLRSLRSGRAVGTFVAPTGPGRIDLGAPS
jgi:hypothetical protein